MGHGSRATGRSSIPSSAGLLLRGDGAFSGAVNHRGRTGNIASNQTREVRRIRVDQAADTFIFDTDLLQSFRRYPLGVEPGILPSVTDVLDQRSISHTKIYLVQRMPLGNGQLDHTFDHALCYSTTHLIFGHGKR